MMFYLCITEITSTFQCQFGNTTISFLSLFFSHLVKSIDRHLVNLFGLFWDTFKPGVKWKINEKRLKIKMNDFIELEARFFFRVPSNPLIKYPRIPKQIFLIGRKTTFTYVEDQIFSFSLSVVITNSKWPNNSIVFGQ